MLPLRGVFVSFICRMSIATDYHCTLERKNKNQVHHDPLAYLPPDSRYWRRCCLCGSRLLRRSAAGGGIRLQGSLARPFVHCIGALQHPLHRRGGGCICRGALSAVRQALAVERWWNAGCGPAPSTSRALVARRAGRRGDSDAPVLPAHVRPVPSERARPSAGVESGELTLVRGVRRGCEAEVLAVHDVTSDGTTETKVLGPRHQRASELRGGNRGARRASTRTVREKAAELEAANAELKAFAHSLTHGLRTPIAAAAAFSQAR